MAQRKPNKLQKQYDQANSKNKTLEEIQNVMIEKYVMKEGNYKILITIYQANDLIPGPVDFLVYEAQKSACDAFVEVEVLGQVRRTPVRKQTNNPIWQEPFYFSFQDLTIEELDRAKIVFNVYDKNHLFLKNSHVGQFEADWTSIYFRRHHQIYRGWLSLSDPSDLVQGPVGYLLVNVAVLGPDDKVMVHDSAFIKDPLTTIEDTISNQKIRLIDYTLNIQIYRAQDLIPLDLASRSVDAYVVAKFSGNKVRSSVVNSLNPQWNQLLKIGTGVPNKTKYVLLQVWNSNLIKDDLIGVIKVPFVDIVEDKYSQPRWGHLYGPPMCAVDQQPRNYATKMQLYGQQLGSHYRGRILFKVVGKRYVYSKNGMNKIQFKFPFKPTPMIPLKTYTLSVQLIQGFRLPDRKKFCIHMAMGNFMAKSQFYSIHQRCIQFFHILPDKKVQFTEDIQQVPDIILYLATGLQQKDRICFVRIKAKDVVTSKRWLNSKIYQLQADKSLNLLMKKQIGGYLTCAVNLYTQGAPANRQIQPNYRLKQPYDLMIYLYKGQNFPPGNLQGDCDPFMKFTCQQQSISSDKVQGSFNPFWSQSMMLRNINLQDVFSTNITKGLVCQAWDDQQNGDHQFIGSFIIELNSSLVIKMKSNSVDKNVSVLYKKPKWYYVKNPHVQIGKNVFGRVLLSIALFKHKDITGGNIPQKYLKESSGQSGDPNDGQLFIPTQEKLLQIYLIGLRDIKDTDRKIIQKGEANLIMNLGSNITLDSGTVELKNNGCEINKLIQKKIRIPKNKNLIPFIDFKVMYQKSFYGYNSVNLYDLLPKLKQKQGLNQQQPVANEDSQETILDVQGLQAQLDMIKQKRKQDKLKELGNKNQRMMLQDLQPPFQLGMVAKTAPIDENNGAYNLQKIYNDFEDQIGDIDYPDYEYIRQMERRKDNMQLQLIQKNQSKVQFQLHNAQLQRIQQADQTSRLNNIPSRTTLNAPYGTFRQQPNKKKTVFDKIREKAEFKKAKKDALSKIENRMMEKKGDQTDNFAKGIEVMFMPRNQMEQIKEQEPLIQSQIKINTEKRSEVMQREAEGSQKANKQEALRQSQVLKVNSQSSVKNDFLDAIFRFQFDKASIKKQFSDIEQQKGNNFQIDLKTQQQFSQLSQTEKAIRYRDVQRVMQQQNKDEKQAIEKDAEYRFGQAVKLTLFGWNRQKKKKEYQTYEDFDTDPGQDLDIVPQWYKGRKILTSDFEDLNFKGSKIRTIPLFGGRSIEDTIFKHKGKQSAGHIKLIVMSQSTDYAKERDQYYTQLLKPKQYYCRIYILQGKSLISGFDVKPSTYLRFTIGNQTISRKQSTYRKEQNNPQYYICHQLPIKLPGPAVIKIQVMETHHIFGQLKEKVLGYTEIDIEQRYFSKRWHLYQKKPIQLRNLYSQYGIGTQGRLQTFIDLIQKKKWVTTPAHTIHPPPFDPYQLRVIVHKTQDCVFKNIQLQSNDIFVRGVIGTSQYQQTDTHWACRSTGNFNYRFKFPVSYPPKPQDMYSDIFFVQIWDRDLVGYNNLIGQTRVNLNKIHRIIQKAVKRKTKAVKAKMRIKQKNFSLTQRFWFDVYNSRIKDEFGIPEVQGRVQMSFELVPKQMAEKQLSNGYGRSQPNVYPTLPEPQGRLAFDFFSPLAFIKQILGPNLYNKWCCRIICCLIIVVLLGLGYIFLPVLLAVSVTK